MNKKDFLKKEFELEICVINDASVDKTKEKVEEKIDIYDNINIINHAENMGLSGGLNSGLKYFYENAKENDILAIMDGDNTHSPIYIHSMLKKIEEGKNCIIASRYQENANIVGLAKNRELMSDLAKYYYKIVLNIPNVKDYTCGYRIYTYDIIKKMLAKFGQNPVKEKSFACMMELLYKIYLVGGDFAEVPFELRYDNKMGESKMKVLTTARKSIITAIKLKVRTKSFITNIIALAILLLFAISLSMITGFNPFGNLYITHDIGIFSYIGMAMAKGRTLYTRCLG